MPENPYLASEMEGLDSFVEESGAVTFPTAFNKLIELVAQEHTQEHRGHLDQISPAAHRQLMRELTYLQSLATGFADGTAAVVSDLDEIDDTASTTDIVIHVAAGVVTGTSTP